MYSINTYSFYTREKERGSGPNSVARDIEMALENKKMAAAPISKSSISMASVVLQVKFKFVVFIVYYTKRNRI